MNNRKKELVSKILSGFIAFSTIFTTLPAITAMAAPAIVTKTNDTLVQVNTVLSAVNKAKKSGSQADMDAAKALTDALSPTDKIRLYVNLSRDFYLQNYKNPGFKYFNAEKYLSKYNDVRLAAIYSGAEDLYAFAVNHYLDSGIYDARSSGTSFDPITALLTQPDLLTNLVFSGKPLPDSLYGAYISRVGSADTSSIIISYSSLDEGSGSSSDHSSRTLYVVTDPTKDTTSQDIVKPSSGEQGIAPAPRDEDEIDYDENFNDFDYDDDDDDNPVPPARREAKLINAQSEIITPYSLYDEDLDDLVFSFETNKYLNGRNAGQEVTVTFFGENYKIAQEISQDKKYTMMIYMCGTDQEIKESYKRVSRQLIHMMNSNQDNINVLLCVGGTANYSNSYMDKDSADGSVYGASGFRSSIYYLNPNGLSDDVKQKLREINLDADDLAFVLEGKLEDKDNIAKGLKYEDIINSNTFIQLSATTAIDMADPALLAGFMNLSTNLFPAEDYGLILSNHGGGLDGGIIVTDDYKDKDNKTIITANSFLANNLESALAATDLFRDSSKSDDGKLGLIFYDACLMGTAEQAYNTKDYFRYMVASEEVTFSWTAYSDLLNDLNNDVSKGASDKEIAINLSKRFSKDPNHKGQNTGKIASIATFSSEDMDYTYSKINELAKELSYVLKDNGLSEYFRNDIFTALRKASLSAYPNTQGSDSLSALGSTSNIDIGEFFTYFNYNISPLSQFTDYTSEDKACLSRIVDKLDEVLNSGFLCYISIQNYAGFGGFEATDYEKAIPLNYTIEDKTIWTDAKNAQRDRKALLYGSGIGMPLFKQFDTGSALISHYKGTELNDYAEFVMDYLTFFNSADGYSKKIDALSKEMSSSEMYSKLITQVEGNNGYSSTLKDENGKQFSYISFKVADSYEEVGLVAPEHSTGIPMLDILETQPTIQLTAIHKEYFDAKADDGNLNGYLKVDMICAEKEIDVYNLALDSNTIYFNITDTTNSIITGFSLNGRPYDQNTNTVENDYDWQFVLKSSLESDSKEKNRVISAVFGGENLPEADTVFSILGGVLYEEKGQTGFTHMTNTYHLFTVGENDSKLEYCGTASYNDVDKTYSKITNTAAISAYHYVLAEEKDENGNTVKYYKTVLEGNDGFYEGFYSTPISGTDIKLYIEKDVNVTENISSTEEKQYSGLSTAYLISPLENGTDYSSIGYIDTPKTYSNGETLGNGKLQVNADEINNAFIGKIGEFLYDETHEDISDVPNVEEDEEDLQNSAKKTQEGENTLTPDAAEGTDTAKAVEADVALPVSEVSDLGEVTEESNSSQEADAAQISDESQSVDATQGSNKPQSIDATQDSNESQSVDATQDSNESQSVDVAQGPEESQEFDATKDGSQNVDAVQGLEESQDIDEAQGLDELQNIDASNDTAANQNAGNNPMNEQLYETSVNDQQQDVIASEDTSEGINESTTEASTEDTSDDSSDDSSNTVDAAEPEEPEESTPENDAA